MLNTSYIKAPHGDIVEFFPCLRLFETRNYNRLGKVANLASYSHFILQVIEFEEVLYHKTSKPKLDEGDDQEIISDDDAEKGKDVVDEEADGGSGGGLNKDEKDSKHENNAVEVDANAEKSTNDVDGESRSDSQEGIEDTTGAGEHTY